MEGDQDLISQLCWKEKESRERLSHTFYLMTHSCHQTKRMKRTAAVERSWDGNELNIGSYVYNVPDLWTGTVEEDSLRKKKSSQEEDQACHQTSKLDRELFLVWRLLLFYNPGSWKPWEFSCNWLPHNFPAMDSLITDRRKRRKKKVSGQFFNQGILTGIRGRAVLILPGIDKRERREELARQLLRT